MTEIKQNTKKLSRRDAIKLLGAATGATVLANLPSKWSTPQLASGVLPAHAQTSSSLFSLTCDPDYLLGPCPPWSLGVTINQPVAGIQMHYEASTDAGTLTSPSPLIGSVPTDGSGYAFVTITGSLIAFATVTIVWSFENPLQGSGTCTNQVRFACS